MGQRRQRLNMFDPAVYRICVAGELSQSWLDYFAARSIGVEVDEAGFYYTILLSEPVDQACLIGMINHLNGLGLPVMSVECLAAGIENEPSEQDDD